MKTKLFTLMTVCALGTAAQAQEESLSVRDSLYNLATEASLYDPLDMTELIVNPNYSGDNREGWEGTPATAVTWGTWEHWNHSFDNWQNIGSDMPKGVYLLNASALHRAGNYFDKWYGSGSLYDESLRTSVLYGKSQGVDICAPVADIMSCATYEPASAYGTAQLANGLYIPDNPESFYYYTLGGYYNENPVYIAVTDGSLTIGWRNLSYVEGQWSITDNWQLQYLGSADEAYQLIKEQQTELIKDLSEAVASASLREEYQAAVEAFSNAESPEDILATLQAMSTLRDAVLANAAAYEAYNAKYKEISDLLNSNEIYGEGRDILENYLEGYEEEGETFPNGSYLYIANNMTLSTEKVMEEIEYMEQLYKTAVESGLGNGTNITYMVKNADFSQSNFAGWESSRSNSGNFYSRTGGKGDGWQQYSEMWLGEAWNCSFDFHQTLKNTLPEGIYELSMHALYRPGQNKYFPAERLPIEVYMNDYTTPVQHIISDGVKGDEAVNHVNCWTDNVGNWPQDDYDEEYGYMPNSSHGASIAFNGGRYAQKAYAIVTDGKLTLGMHHTRQPYYDEDWCTWGNWQLVYRAHSEEATDAMLQNMADRADMLAAMTETYIYAGHISALQAAISTAKACTDNEEKYGMLKGINGLINDAYAGIQVYDSLYKAIEFITENALTGNPIFSEQRVAELEALVNTYWDGMTEGQYTDEEARKIISDIYAMPDFDVIYTYGDMVDGDWNEACYLYPLKRQANGHYTGHISLQDRSENWGGRASFFFVYQGKRLGRETDSRDRFFTPAHNTKKMGLLYNKDNDCFNTTGGEFDVDIDLENMQIEMNPTAEYPWPENVYLAGTLPTGHWQRNDACPLEHQGNGVYEGVYELQDFDNGRAGVTLFACRDPYDWDHARYGNAGYTNDVTKDVIYGDLNRYRGDTKWLVPVGEYCIAFDMNNETIVFCDASKSGADCINTVGGKISLQGKVKVYTLGGKLVYEGDGNGFNLQSGTYIIRSAEGSMKLAK